MFREFKEGVSKYRLILDKSQQALLASYEVIFDDTTEISESLKARFMQNQEIFSSFVGSDPKFLVPLGEYNVSANLLSVLRATDTNTINDLVGYTSIEEFSDDYVRKSR